MRLLTKPKTREVDLSDNKEVKTSNNHFYDCERYYTFEFDEEPPEIIEDETQEDIYSELDIREIILSRLNYDKQC